MNDKKEIACLLLSHPTFKIFHNMLTSVIRYLGPEYTGEYRDSTKIIKTLIDAKCPQDIVKDVDRILNVGCPNYLNDTSSRENRFIPDLHLTPQGLYWRYFRINLQPFKLRTTSKSSSMVRKVYSMKKVLVNRPNSICLSTIVCSSKLEIIFTSP